MTLAMPVRIGPYEIGGLVGKGGMGEVFRALDTRIGREVAVKVLPAALTTDPERLRRFEQEARTAGQLNHPSIVTVYDVGTHEGSPYIVQELLDGETLAVRLAGGPLPHGKVIQYGAAIAAGLAAAHAKGIVHRDLKPANLFVTRDGRIKILDFGLAKLTPPPALGGSDLPTGTVDPSPETHPGVILGTVGYMSPEQVRGQPADARSDIFALGTILYEMVSGHRPFAGPTAPEVLSAILNSDPPELSQPSRPVPTGLEAIIRHCLEKKPGERYQSAQDLGFQLSSSRGPTDPRTTSTASQPRYVRTFVVIGLFCLGLGAAGGFYTSKLITVAPAPPSFRPLTFRHGLVKDARFGPDGQTVLMSAIWDDQVAATVYQGHVNRPGWLPLGFSGYNTVALSAKGELLLLGTRGSLARAPITGGAPRTLRSGLDSQGANAGASISSADWAPDGESVAAISNRIVRHSQGAFGSTAGLLEWPLDNVIAELQKGAFGLVRVSHDGTRLAVAERAETDLLGQPGEKTVVLVDRNGKKTPLSAHWSELTGLAWTPDDAAICVSGAWNGQPAGISAVMLDGSVRSISRVPGILRLLDVGPDGRALALLEESRAEVKAFPPGGLAEVNLPDSVVPHAFSGDGRQLLYSDDSGVYLGPTDGSPPIHLGKYRGASALSPDGKSVLAQSPKGELLVVSAVSGSERRVSVPGRKVWSAIATWLTNDRIAVAAGDDWITSTLWAVDIGRGTAKEVAPLFCPDPIASPDGNWVVCGSKAFPVDGGIPLLIRSEPVLAWDLDGRHVYCLASLPPAWPMVIDRVEVGSGKRTRWKTMERPDRLAGPWDSIGIAPGAVGYVYRFTRHHSRLYLVEGMEYQPR